jgi:hypothetical protein
MNKKPCISNTPVYENQQSEAVFRHWQDKYNACLLANWNASTPKIHFDKFCLQRYTGRMDFELEENSK